MEKDWTQLESCEKRWHPSKQCLCSTTRKTVNYQVGKIQHLCAIAEQVLYIHQAKGLPDKIDISNKNLIPSLKKSITWALVWLTIFLGLRILFSIVYFLLNMQQSLTKSKKVTWKGREKKLLCSATTTYSSINE